MQNKKLSYRRETACLPIGWLTDRAMQGNPREYPHKPYRPISRN